MTTIQNCVQNPAHTPSTFMWKERDEETGYGYFSFSPLDFTSFVIPSGTLSKVHRTFFTRYLDASLMTGWLSVDPMADKYPNISPCCYCHWSPIKLFDSNGKWDVSVHAYNNIFVYGTAKLTPILPWMKEKLQYQVEKNYDF
jgi:hypothetical protein